MKGDRRRYGGPTEPASVVGEQPDAPAQPAVHHHLGDLVEIEVRGVVPVREDVLGQPAIRSSSQILLSFDAAVVTGRSSTSRGGRFRDSAAIDQLVAGRIGRCRLMVFIVVMDVRVIRCGRAANTSM